MENIEMKAVPKSRVRYKVPPRDTAQMDLNEAMGNTVVKKQSQIGEVLKRLRKNKSAMLGCCIFIFFCLVAIFSQWIAPYDYEQMDVMNMFAKPSAEHWLGTDQYGRDILSRLIVGARYSLGLGLCSTLYGLVIGIVLGCIAGYAGGWVDNLIMRLMDILQAIPGMLLAVVLSTALGGGWLNTVIAMGVGGISMSCRTIRAQFLSVRGLEYIEAAQAIDVSKTKIIFKHMFPNCVSPLIVQTTMGIGGKLMSAAGLSYLGLGVQPPIPEWGAMLTAGKAYFRTEPLIMFWPGLCVAIVVLACNMFGDGLRDALDPKLKN